MGLSHPALASVNDGSVAELCMLKYTSVDETVKLIFHQGQAGELPNLDIESTYTIVPIHPTGLF